MMYGQAGEQWLAELPEIISLVQKTWNLTIRTHFNSTTNFVASVTLPGNTSAVVKLSIPDDQLTNEIKALQYYDGKCFSKLIDAIEDRGAMLLEELLPGNNLTSIPDDKAATRIVAGLIKQMSEIRRAGYTFSNTKKFARDFEKMKHGAMSTLPQPWIQKGIEIFDQLIDSQTNSHLLHGDLHHENVLLCNGQWKLIDPKGFIGESSYEIIPFLNNNLPTVDFGSTIEHRVNIFAKELALEPERVYRWGFAYSMLSAWWDIEDNLGYSTKSAALISYYDRLT